MTAVFKYPLNLGVPNYLFCGEILHFGEQHGQFWVWAKSEPPVNHEIYLVATGMYFDDPEYRHIGTSVTDDGNFVVHAFAS